MMSKTKMKWIDASQLGLATPISPDLLNPVVPAVAVADGGFILERERQPHAQPARGIKVVRAGRIEPDAYCAEIYRNVQLRYVHDPKNAGKVRVYVESEIDWKGRNQSAHVSHLWPRNHDGNFHPPYICFKSDFAPSTYEEAKKLAEGWVRGTERYIATGECISDQVRRLGTL